MRTTRPLPRPAAAGCVFSLILFGVLALAGAPATAVAGSHADRAHARAVESFRLGRFPEAYGRFVELADVGHAPSAQYALWMCEHGPALFGKQWDCSPQQVEDWARAGAGTVVVTAARRDAALAPARTTQRR